MKILVLNGSPKRDKSDTMHITRAFLDGMREAAPQEIRVIDIIDRHIEYCTGCFACMRNGGTCIHDDDMRDILEGILSSDLLIWNFPLYCYGMPAPLKALLDRTLPLSSMAMQRVGDRYEHVGQADFSHLRYLMICGCGFLNSRHNFESAVAQFKLCFPGNHTVITVPESPMFNAPEAAEEAARKKKTDFSKVEFFTYDEGLSVQCLHIGPYDDEPDTVERMHRYMEEQGYTLDISDQRLHHEIYLSDARKVAPEKLKTVIRHPIRKG